MGALSKTAWKSSFLPGIRFHLVGKEITHRALYKVPSRALRGLVVLLDLRFVNIKAGENVPVIQLGSRVAMVTSHWQVGHSTKDSPQDAVTLYLPPNFCLAMHCKFTIYSVGPRDLTL